MADGAASFVRGAVNDIAATFFNVAYGSGQALPPPYVLSHSSDDQEQGLSDLVGGAVAALGQLLPDRAPAPDCEQSHCR
jgi:hypothetical protein